MKMHSVVGFLVSLTFTVTILIYVVTPILLVVAFWIVAALRLLHSLFESIVEKFEAIRLRHKLATFLNQFALPGDACACIRRTPNGRQQVVVHLKVGNRIWTHQARARTMHRAISQIARRIGACRRCPADHGDFDCAKGAACVRSLNALNRPLTKEFRQFHILTVLHHGQ